ncbi:Copper methylamine oxidase [Seminavis robusta]|uniref:Amine oxidase n=1 Tax=Seminavis robusta TaxID=568900 RepID=A0A9N8DQ98_9STRA|nr:Copper methylamine oxidase [Seminavis robusta]|eukprot:Sro207_g086890.1 Copper methylamine oxidase (670) ;mRNA; r:54168-56569
MAPYSHDDDATDAVEPSPSVHPLDPLSKHEIIQAVEIVKKDLNTASLRFETIELFEPLKSAVREFDQSNNGAVAVVERKARVNAFTIGPGIGVWKMVVSLTNSSLCTKTFLPQARPMIQLEEFEQIEKVVKEDERVIAACAKRGITDMSLLCVDPWSSGTFGESYEQDRHLSYAFLWVRSKELDNLYAHPVSGLNPVVDIKEMKVVHVDDWEEDVPEKDRTPIPSKECNYDRVFLGEDKKPRTDLNPINVVQPEGVSFSLRGHTLKWHDWSILVGFNGREGITLHNIKYQGRPICYRASLSEMVVPYGSPKAPHYRKNVFDIGEYGLGNMANSLKLGCDCVGAIQYMDGWISDIQGNPQCIENAICIHEEDFGILWKHWDFRTDRTEMRRARRLVVSSISTVGNYEYGSYWYFYLDGTIEFEMKATGIINTVACPPMKPDRYGTEVTPGVFGQIHQHIFCARLDMSVDGDENTVVECNTVAVPMGKDNPYGNAFYVESTPLVTEGGRYRNPDSERFWKVTNPSKTNHVGQPVSYKLEPTHSVKVFTHPNSPSGRRMGWTYNHLWVTPYDEEERYPTGDFVNQHDGSNDLSKWVQKERSIENTDIVAWHVFGLHHPVRPEDFPVQNAINTGFKLMPVGFFDQNPNIIDLPFERNQASKYASEASASACCQ